jgi:hypothetical protein
VRVFDFVDDVIALFREKRISGSASHNKEAHTSAPKWLFAMQIESQKFRVHEHGSSLQQQHRLMN